MTEEPLAAATCWLFCKSGMESCVSNYCAFTSVLQDQDKEYVGFATLPNQVHRKTVKKGFTFTLMVAGEESVTLFFFFF